MSIETELKSTITPLLAGGCHSVINLASTVILPYAAFCEVSGTPCNTVHGKTEATSSHYQVDVFAKSPEQAKGLSVEPIKTAIETSPTLQGTLVMERSGEYDPTTKTFQYITEYQVWDIPA